MKRGGMHDNSVGVLGGWLSPRTAVQNTKWRFAVFSGTRLGKSNPAGVARREFEGRFSRPCEKPSQTGGQRVVQSLEAKV